MIAELRCRERDFTQLEIFALLATVDKDAVPVNLQIGGDADSRRADGQFPAEIRCDRPRQACREAHVVGDTYPFLCLCGSDIPVRASLCRAHFVGQECPTHMAVTNFCFHIWRCRLDPCLRSGIHSGRGEVFDLAVHQQAQRPSAIRLAKIKDQAMRLSEAFKRQQIELANILVSQQIGEQIVSLVVPCSGGRSRALTRYDLELGYGGLLAKYSLG